MHSLTNVPYKRNLQAEIRGVVDGTNVEVRCFDTDRIGHGFASSGMTSMYIGDHMFEPDKREALRQMVADALATAIRMGRDAGYAQAQQTIRNALGCSS